MNKVFLTEEQARVGIVAGMWTNQVIEDAKKLPDGHLRDNYYLMEVYAPHPTGNGQFPNS